MTLKPTRRNLMKLAALAPAMAMPLTARAEIGAPSGDNPSHFRFSIGEARITIVSDGFFTTPVSGIGLDTDPAEVQAFLASHFLSTERNFSHTNHMYVEIGDAKVLVDVGSGTRLFDTTGRLMDNLDAAGIDSQDITHVVITHAHPDHILGIRDDFDEAILPDASYTIGRIEHDYWMQDDLVNTVAEADQSGVLAAVNSINADGVEWILAEDGHEIVPGLTMMHTPGHTSGHMSIRIDSNGQTLIALGDCLTNAHVNFAYPDWKIARDIDKDMAANTRRKVLGMAADERIAVLGYHFPFPGVGHVRREGDAFQFVPALWRFET